VPLDRTPDGFLGDGEMMVVSFDIDGTMEFGNPPGPIAVALVKAMAELGHVVGSGSDRTRTDQAQLWEAHGVDIHFVGGKHHLPDVRERFTAPRYVHIGDTDVDAHFAKAAGFDFYWSHEFDWTD
jgi:phosphoglycolate phosphatase-like HAD superfamily hydrolase